MAIRRMRRGILVAAALLGGTHASQAAMLQDTPVITKPHIDIANGSGILPGINTRSAGSVEQISITFIGSDGLPAPQAALSVTTSSAALLTVTPTAQPGIYTLTVPANTVGGNATLIATAVVNGVSYAGGRNFGHLAYRVSDIYGLCEKLMAAGVTINRPPRDGWMAFVRSPDGISIELLQEGAALAPAEPWVSMPNIGAW